MHPINRRFASIAAGVLVSAVVGVSTPGHAQPFVGSGAWANPFGAFSWCEQSATTTVTCEHDAVAGGEQGLATTCTSGTVDLGGITVVGSCVAVLEGDSAGVGKVVTPGYAPDCATFGIQSGTLTFTDAAGATYSVTVTIVNLAGEADFFGQTVNAAGVVLARTEGTFTMACGSPSEGIRGSFTGTFEVGG